MANPGGKNQYGGPYKGARLKNAAKKAGKSAARAASGSSGSSGGAPRRVPPAPIQRLSNAELADLARTPAGRRKIRQIQRANEDRIAAPAREAARRAGFTGAKPRRKRRK